jgi:hypothetical protein
MQRNPNNSFGFDFIARCDSVAEAKMIQQQTISNRNGGAVLIWSESKFKQWNIETVNRIINHKFKQFIKQGN